MHYHKTQKPKVVQKVNTKPVFLLSPRSQDGIQTKILHRSDLAPILLYKNYFNCTCCILQCIFLCLVTEQQIVFMPKISAKKNYQMTEETELFFLLFFQNKHSCFPLQTHNVLCFKGMKHEKNMEVVSHWKRIIPACCRLSDKIQAVII